MDQKLTAFESVGHMVIPGKGWLNAVRTSLKMTLQQFGTRLNITPQSARELELREANGTITLNGLRDAANALDMKLVYGIIPKDGSIEAMIEKRAAELARKIVLRTSNSMKLEDQENSAARIEQAIKEKTEEIKDELPKYLWE